jgi:pilus assembly protein CpaF
VDENGRFRGTLRSTGLRATFTERLADQGITLPADLFTDQRPRR